jgi:hypothetical protein
MRVLARGKRLAFLLAAVLFLGGVLWAAISKRTVNGKKRFAPAEIAVTIR